MGTPRIPCVPKTFSHYKEKYNRCLLSGIVYAVINNSPKCYIFWHLIDNFCMQSYLLILIYLKKFRRYITKYTCRSKSHSLAIESGRYKNIARNDRKCTFCYHKDIEDVFHFLLKCPLYNSFRSRYIKNYYVKKTICIQMCPVIYLTIFYVM